jgi:recombination protein RecT
LPDGREGAIVPFGDTDEDAPGGKASDTASWMPMIGGIRKKARNSGEISDWYAEVVHEGDEFDFQLGDDPHIHHKPSLNGGRTRKIIAAYSICKFKDGTIAREVMSIDEIEDVRKHYSRAKRGPWSDPIAYPEMCRKSVARLHSKQLPMSNDLDTLLRRDDELYDFKQARQEGEKAKRGRPSTTKAALDHFAGGDSNPGDDDVEQTSAGLGDAQPALDVPAQQTSAQLPSPKTPEAYFDYARAVITRMDNKDAAKKWFNEDGQRRMRKDIGIPVDDTLKFVEEVFGQASRLQQPET